MGSLKSFSQKKFHVTDNIHDLIISAKKQETTHYKANFLKIKQLNLGKNTSKC